MAQTGRNQPCPCGSGKKYKKCCFAKDSFLGQEKKEELLELVDRLVDFTVDVFEDEIDEEIETLCQNEDVLHFILDDQFKAGYLAWRIFHTPLFSSWKPFDDFLVSESPRSLPTWLNVEEWRDSYPSFYEVTRVQEGAGRLSDLFQQTTHDIFLPGDFPLQEGDIIAATLLSAGPQTNTLLLPPALLGKRDKTLFSTMIEREYEKYREAGRKGTDQKVGFLREHFVRIYISVYTSYFDRAMNSLQEALESQPWGKELYQETLRTFLAKAKRKRLYTMRTLRAACLLWFNFCATEAPRVKKADAPAAALEYFSVLAEDIDITQNELAGEYGVSSGSVSRWYNHFMDHIDAIRRLDEPDEEDQPEHNPSFRIATERHLSKVHKILESREFSSEEELNTFLRENSQLIGEGAFDDKLGPLSEKEKARELLYDAFESPPGKREGLIRKALDLYPDSPDAYYLLAEQHTDPEEALKLYLQGVRAGEKDLGKEFFAQEKGHFWGIMETRPYMRAKMGYAYILLHLGRREEAVRQFHELLELNSQDNQGVRYPLLTALLEGEQYKEAKKLLLKYPEDCSADFLYNHVLVEYGLRGLSFNLNNLLKEAKKRNPHVPSYLLGKKPLPSIPPAYVGRGDEKEAAAYAYGNRHLWQGKKNLLSLLSQR